MPEARLFLVTGATSGIGFATTVELLRRGARVVPIGPSAEAVDAARARMRALGLSPLAGDAADFEDLDAVRALAERQRALHPRIDGLLNNAGVLRDTPRITPHGHEHTWCVNYLAAVVLSVRLLSCVSAARGHILNVTSSSHAWARSDFAMAHDVRAYSGLAAYARSKLALLLFTQQLAQQVAASGVRCNAVHPGVIATGIAQGHGFIGGLMRVGRGLLSSPERAAKAVGALLTGDAQPRASGEYFEGTRRRRPGKPALDAAAREALWGLTSIQTGETFVFRRADTQRTEP